MPNIFNLKKNFEILIKYISDLKLFYQSGNILQQGLASNSVDRKEYVSQKTRK